MITKQIRKTKKKKLEIFNLIMTMKVHIPHLLKIKYNLTQKIVVQINKYILEILNKIIHKVKLQINK